MHIAARSYLSTGVALVGAGAIAISPIAPPLPDAKVPTLSAIGVELNAAVNPIQTWIDVFGTAAENLAILGQKVAENPAPILQQVITNQLSYIEQLTPAFQEFAEGFVAALNPMNPDGIPANVQAAFEQIFTGNPAEGFPALFQAFLTPILFPALGVLGGVQNVITASAQNMLDVSNLAVTAFATVALGAISPIASGFSALGAATQAIVDAANDGDILGVVTAVLDVPGVVTGAVLNGFGFDGGLLSADFGTINGFLNLRQMIADALKPAAPAAAGVLSDGTTTVSEETGTTATFEITDGEASLVQGAALKTSENPAPETDGAAVADDESGNEVVDQAPDDDQAADEASEDDQAAEEIVDQAPEDDELAEEAAEDDEGAEEGTDDEGAEPEPSDPEGANDAGDDDAGSDDTEGAEA